MDRAILVTPVIIYGLSSIISLALHILTFRDEEKWQICLKAISSTILAKGKNNERDVAEDNFRE